MNRNFSHSKPYFVYDPEGDGLTYFETQEERDAFAQECIRNYLDPDGWSVEVVNVVAGVVTHSAQQVDREDRPDELDEEGVDESGAYWDPDWEYKCNYALRPVGKEDER